MNCKDYSLLIEEDVEGSLDLESSEKLAVHVATCRECAEFCEELETEREIYSRYLLKIREQPESWEAVLRGIRNDADKSRNVPVAFFERFSEVPRQRLFEAIAALLLLIGISMLYRSYIRTGESDFAVSEVQRNESSLPPRKNDRVFVPDGGEVSVNGAKSNRRTRNERKRSKPSVNKAPDNAANEGFVSFDSSDTAFNRYLEKCEMVLRSFRNALPESDAAFDISYERRLSKNLLKNTVKFRRVAQSGSNPQVEELLVNLEVLLGDIANLPRKATLADAKVVKGRIRESGIIAKLQVISSLARASE